MKLKSFSLAEMMIVMVVISIILAATMPLVTKKSSSSGVTKADLDKLKAELEEEIADVEDKAKHGQIICTRISCTGNVGEDGASITGSGGTYNFTPPTGVTRFYVTVVGAGGGASDAHGGAGESLYGSLNITSAPVIIKVGTGGGAPIWTGPGIGGAGYGNGNNGLSGNNISTSGISAGGGGSSAFNGANAATGTGIIARGGGGGGSDGYCIPSKVYRNGVSGGNGGGSGNGNGYSGGAGGPTGNPVTGKPGSGGAGYNGYGLGGGNPSNQNGQNGGDGVVIVEW